MNSQNNPSLSAALDYADRFGFSVIPCSGEIDPKENKVSKISYVQWREYQKRKATPEEIRAWWRNWPGAMIGIVTGEISGLFVIDCDSREGYEAVQKLLPDTLIIPTVRTPKGWHLWFLFSSNYKVPNRAKVLPDVDVRTTGGYVIAPPSRNAEGKSYFWEKGLSLAEVAPASIPSALQRALSLNKDKVHYRGGVDSYVDSEDFFIKGRRDEDLFTIANALVKENLSEKIIKQTLDIIASNCKPPFPLHEAEEKIRSAMARAERRDRVLAAEVKEWVLSTTGVFLSTEIYNCLHLSTRDERKNVSIILKRLQAEGIIEKYGNKNGQYRCLDDDIEPLDWKNADITPFGLRWPFGIENLVSIYPGNIAVLAGTANSGKTSFVLNFIRLNQKKYPVHLFSSEGGPEELKQRLSKFDYPESDWIFKAWSRSRDFADVIHPDAINVIDYLEIHDDFYKVGGILKGISDKLKTGFCLIALQKNQGRDEGLGGGRGLEKPRLYLAMDGGRLKIVKGKSWANPEKNPNGLSIRFKLVDGAKFIIESRWEREAV